MSDWWPTDDQIRRAQEAEGLTLMEGEEFDPDRWPHVVSRLRAYHEQGLIKEDDDER